MSPRIRPQIEIVFRYVSGTCYALDEYGDLMCKDEDQPRYDGPLEPEDMNDGDNRVIRAALLMLRESGKKGP